MAELVSGTEPDAASGHAARSEVAKVRRADYDLKLEPVLAQRDHEDCRWPQRNDAALRAGIFEALGSIDPISVGHRRFGEESRNRTIQPQGGPMALWRVPRSAARVGFKTVDTKNSHGREAPRSFLTQLGSPSVSVEPK